MKWEIVRLAIRKKRNLEYLLLNFEIYLFILINHIISLVKLYLVKLIFTIMDGFPGCGVYLRVLAQEKCKWTETSTSTSTDSESNTSISTTTYTYTGNWNYIILKVLYYHQGNLYFLFNFNFSLIFLVHIMKRIQHKLAVLSKKSSYNSIINRQRLIIREPIRQNKKPLNGQMLVHSQDCCFPSDGPCHVNCSIDKLNYLQEMQLIYKLTFIIQAQMNKEFHFYTFIEYFDIN